ncbi:MAG: hypothetical protein ACXWV4_04780 [Flavitalea sp.]
MDKQKKVGPNGIELNKDAFKEAMHDLEEDAELTATSPNDDLDEGETARLGENDLLTTDGEAPPEEKSHSEGIRKSKNKDESDM